MKQLIVLVGMVLLGCVIFDLMVGPGEESLRAASAEAMRKTMEAYG